MHPRSGQTLVSAASISLAQVVEALRGCVPTDPAMPVDLETGFAYNALLARGWPGVLVSRTAPDPSEPALLRGPSTVHYCMRLDGHTANARGEDFSQIWISGEPPQSCPFEPTETVIRSTGSAFVSLQSSYPEIHASIRDRIDHLVRSQWSSGQMGQETPHAMVAGSASRL